MESPMVIFQLENTNFGVFDWNTNKSRTKFYYIPSGGVHVQNISHF